MLAISHKYNIVKLNDEKFIFKNFTLGYLNNLLQKNLIAIESRLVLALCRILDNRIIDLVFNH
tara:strand:- start:288 stop:476 length:189 start_codon:yes stop_codon:yes gene_type:complete